MFFFLRPLRLLVRALVADNSPNQMAAGLALGLMIGLVPKGNLLAIGLMLLMGAVRVNLGVGMLTAFCVSWLGLLIDPLTHQIGGTLLRHPALQAVWTDCYSLPVLPWTKFNNTVVLGSFVLGIGLFLPAFFISRPLFAKYTPDCAERLQKMKVGTALMGADLTAKLN